MYIANLNPLKLKGYILTQKVQSCPELKVSSSSILHTVAVGDRVEELCLAHGCFLWPTHETFMISPLGSVAPSQWEKPFNLR